jgi:hypothetical protein
MNLMNTKILSPSELIAPCGMNCGVCYAHLREKNKCPGCREDDFEKPITRKRCKIKTCDKLKFAFCFKCKDFPCDKILHLDKRYRTKYNMSMIENLLNIQKYRINKFVKSEKLRWTCSKCKGTICVHTGQCICCKKKINIT